MAKQLVSAMTGEFDPAQYKDEYREALETIIEAKVEGRETVEIEEPEESGKLIDLMAALEASCQRRQGRRGSRSRGARVGCRGTRRRRQGAPRPSEARRGRPAKPAARSARPRAGGGGAAGVPQRALPDEEAAGGARMPDAGSARSALTGRSAPAQRRLDG